MRHSRLWKIVPSRRSTHTAQNSTVRLLPLILIELQLMMLAATSPTADMRRHRAMVLHRDLSRVIFRHQNQPGLTLYPP